VTSIPLEEAAARLLLRKSAGKAAFEEQHLTFHQYRRMRRVVSDTTLIPARGVMERLCESKDEEEVRSIRKAVAITDKVFAQLLPRVKAGMRELDVAAEISWLTRKLGGEKDAFEPIVAGGRRGALPHARPTGGRLKTGECVILDFGCTVDGYHSDMTRTIAIGRISAPMKRAYVAVCNAQALAIAHVKAGVPASVLDGLARNELRKARLERYFIHSLGHGVGLQIHEQPRLSSTSRDVLVEDSVVTIEPGVYVPSLGGIRIEDVVRVTRTGCEVLTASSRELQVI
jgi:Xaa-Pro aminopeptidase